MCTKNLLGYFLVFASIVLLGLQACSLEETAICPEDTERYDAEAPIKFTTKAPTAPLTRTNFDGTEWLLNDSVGIYMLYDDGSAAIANSINFNRKYYTVNGSPFDSKSGYDLLKPPGAQEMYYHELRALRFIAYYPYLANISNYTIPLDVSKQERPQDIDVLYSDNAKGITTATPGVDKRVTLDFHHVLSKLVINVGVGEHTDVNIHGMTGLINQVPLTGTLQLDQYTNLTPGTQLNNLGFVGFNTTRPAGYDTTYQAILIPHHIDHAKELVQFRTVRRLYSWKLPDELTDFEQGKVYTFNLTLNGETDVAFTASITPWDSVYKNGTNPNVDGALDESGAPFRRVVGNGVDTLDVVYIGGNVTFDMGTTKAPVSGSLRSTPVHSVYLDHSYHIMNAPVTNAQYCRFLNDPDNHLTGNITTGSTGGNVNVTYWIPTTEVSQSASVMLYTPVATGTNYAIVWNSTTKKWEPATAAYANYPMTGVSWYGALAYAKWAGGTLPAEAQWEYAARGGVDIQYDYIDGQEAGNNTGATMNLYALGNAGAPVAVKGSRRANGYGLYDMFGNVHEWCYERVGTTSDSYDADYATAKTSSTATSANGITRGYYYGNALTTFIIGARNTFTLNTTYPYLGFRVVFDFEK